MNMKLKVAAGLALLSLIPTAAMAHTDLSIGLNLGGGGYYEPAPVYVAPPPPRVYYGPARVYYDYGPTVTYREYYGYGANRDRHHDYSDDRYDHARYREYHR